MTHFASLRLARYCREATAALLVVWLASAAVAADRLAVHEWGTFTCLQDETGRTIAGVNTDDEPLRRSSIVGQWLHLSANRSAALLYKGVPWLHPQVTMRLETPVIYFYPPAGRTTPLKLDVRVQFRGGWLSEYYPNARRIAPRRTGRQLGRSPQTTGSLQWNNLQVGGDARPRNRLPRLAGPGR